MAMVGLLLVSLLFLVAFFIPIISPHDPYRVALDEQFLPPSSSYWLGTDNFGRDLLTRILYGARISLLVGIVPSFISLMIGAVLIADGFGVHVPKGYIYAAMAFSALVEGLNMWSRNAQIKKARAEEAAKAALNKAETAEPGV